MEEQNTQIQIRVNGRPMTKEEFEIEKTRLREQKIQLVESGPNNYVTRLYD
jgi:hypothetical protein